MLDRWRVCFLNCLTILSNFCFSWQKICPPQQVPLLPPAHSILALWCWEQQQQGPYSMDPPQGGWWVPHVGLGQALQRTQRCFISPGTNENGPKSFRAAPVYSRVRPELQACLKMSHSSDILSVCPHIACMVPTHQILLFMQPLEFPRLFNLSLNAQWQLFLMTQKHLSIVFLASLLVSTGLFPILDFVLKFCFCMDTQQKSTSCQLSINKNLWFVVLRINPQSSLHNCLDIWGSVLLIFFCFFVFFVCFYFCI